MEAGFWANRRVKWGTGLGGRRVRTIILHYHLFKNAGTSLDRILQRNFPERWVTREFRGINNTADVTRWIQDHPDAVAFSSHTMMGPLPRIPDVQIFSVMLLRDPVARIRSAYRFERTQHAETLGAVLARHTDLEGYVRVRLAMPGDRQCNNFQTYRLASLVPGPEPELERARLGLDHLSLVGKVEAFGLFLETLTARMAPWFPDFDAGDEVHANASDPSKAPVPEASALTELLASANHDDKTLVEEIGP